MKAPTNNLQRWTFYVKVLPSERKIIQYCLQPYVQNTHIARFIQKSENPEWNISTLRCESKDPLQKYTFLLR